MIYKYIYIYIYLFIFIFIYKIKKINIHELLFKSVKTLGNIVSVDTC